MSKVLCKVISLFLSFLICISAIPTLPVEAVQYYSEAALSNINCSIISNSQKANYVNNMMKYHILSSTDNFRVARNLQNGSSVVFFFDGCSDNVDDPTYGNYNKYHLSAYCAVVQEVNGSLKIVYESENCSTIPDNPQNASLNGGDAVPTVLDGVYNIYSINHLGRYAALHIANNSGTVPAIRCSWSSSYVDSSAAINIHARSGFSNAPSNGISQSSYSSTGCFNVGLITDGWNEYNKFISATLGISNAVITTPYSNGSWTKCTEWIDKGVVIVDRSQYKAQLEQIYGGDSHFSASTLVRKITEYTDNLDIEIAPGEHTCNKGEYVYYEAVHPHYKCYRCSVCGEIWRDTSEPTMVATCTTCYPPKTVDERFSPYMPAGVYPLSTGRINVYDAAGNVYDNRYIDGATDICVIWEIYTDGWCKVRYPSTAEESGHFDAYVPLSTFTATTNQFVWIAEADYNTYKRADLQESMLTISSGMNCLVLDSRGSLRQVLHPVSGQDYHLMDWIDYEHTCNRGEYVFFEEAHPHYSCYKCSICGNVWADTTSSNRSDACATCNHPEKPVLNDMRETYFDVENIIFSWGNTSNTTHYALRFEVKSADGDWIWLNHVQNVESGYSRSFDVGEYRCTLQSYNSNFWNADGSDWIYAESDPVYFTVRRTHLYRETVTPPTCTERGYTTHTCTCGCGDSFVDDYIDALGHTWDNGIITRQPTEDTEGIKTFTCNRCNATRTESIPVIPHEHSYSAIVTAPTCIERGYTTHTCECGESYDDSYVNPLGHAWNSGIVTTQPSEDTEGIKTYTCSRCNVTRTESISVIPHEHGYSAVVTAPTCTEAGYTTYTCECGESYTDNVVPATGHDWDNGVITRQPTENAEGVRTFTCENCDATRTEPIPVLEPTLPTLTGTYTTDLIMPAADLGVSAPDSVLRATLTFGEDGSASCTWEAVDLTAFRIFFHDMFVNAYYAMAYGAGITDLAEIEQFCIDSTGLSVSDYMDTLVTDQAMIESFTPASTSGTYSHNADHSAILTDLAIMDVPSDPNVENSFVLGGGTLYLTAASWDKPDYTFVCTAQ